jgi:hypothetical protein
LIEVTPTPVFAWFKGLDDRMVGVVKMFGGMAIWGRVAAADVAADQTKTQMDPPAARLQAIFAALGAGRDRLDLIGVGTAHQVAPYGRLSWLR